MLKFEKLLADGRAVFTDTVNGRIVRATTRHGVQGAKAMFEIIRATGGSQTSPASRMDSRPTRSP